MVIAKARRTGNYKHLNTIGMSAGNIAMRGKSTIIPAVLKFSMFVSIKFESNFLTKSREPLHKVVSLDFVEV